MTAPFVECIISLVQWGGHTRMRQNLIAMQLIRPTTGHSARRAQNH